MPGYAKRKRRFASPEEYLDAVVEKKVRDSVISFQLNEGCEPRGIFPDYILTDRESGGNAVLMYWPNPLAPRDTGSQVPGLRERLPTSVRVATVQWQMRRIATIDEFEEQVEYWIDVAADRRIPRKSCIRPRRSGALICAHDIAVMPGRSRTSATL